MNPFATATELLADLRAGRVTSSELTETYIGRIEKHDGRLNAVVERDFERGREQARAADRGGSGALRGLPITLKESFNVNGLRTTCGVPGWKDFERPAGALHALYLLPICRHRCWPAGDRVSRGDLPRGLADWPAGDRPVSRGPDTDPLRGVAREPDRRVHEAGRLRRLIGRLGRAR